MVVQRLLSVFVGLVSLVPVAAAQPSAVLPVIDDKPTPQVDAGGPMAAVMALAFSADGGTLYAAGLDKLVRVWGLQQGRFEPKTAYRTPIGPGNAGSINAIAVSPDGAWIAMAGRAPIRGEAGFRQSGFWMDSAYLTPEQNQDLGVIYVASTANPAGGKVLRGHHGEVRSLAFVPAEDGKPTLLVSAATERDGARRFGGVRLWDVGAGKQLAETNDLPDAVVRPALAVFRGENKEAVDIRVAIAWPDGRLSDSIYLWSPQSADKPLRKKADPFTSAAAWLPQKGNARIMTGGAEIRNRGTDAAGRLASWDFAAANGGPLPSTVEFPSYLPVSVVVFAAAGGGGAPDHAAVLLRPLDKLPDARFRLAIVDLNAKRVVVNFPLAGSHKNRLPALAVRDRHLAVAASGDHAVALFTIADLLGGNLEPKAVLGGGATPSRQVEFVDNGTGLWLTEDAAARPLDGGLLFDFDKRQVRGNDGARPQADRVMLGDWSLAIDHAGKRVRVLRGGNETAVASWRGKDVEITAAALRPPAQGARGLLAVAHTERDSGRSLIVLYDPADGKPFRVLNGHLQDVRALSFSARRPLLASAGDDQTIRVWSLDPQDLDKTYGIVAGLGVVDKNNRVVVERIEPASAAAKLAADDVLETMRMPGGQASPIENTSAFYTAIASLPPGIEVELAVRGKGAVKLPIERGIDERKPLFSLMLFRERGLPHWLGWSPEGPYDCDSPAAEAHLGWHTNTGLAATPVSYAPAADQRKQFYRVDILRYLGAEGNLGRALNQWNAANPEIKQKASLYLLPPDGAAPTDRIDEHLIRRPLATLSAGVNEDYKLDGKHVLRWRVVRSDNGKVKGNAGEAAGEARHDDQNNEWRIDLAGVEWRRGDYQVRLRLDEGDRRPDSAQTSMVLHFVPPAPTLALRRGENQLTTSETKPLIVMDDKLSAQIALDAPAGQKIDVRFDQSCNGQTRPEAPTALLRDGPGKFTQEFKLHKGLNHLTVRAVNHDATAFADKEAGSAEAWIAYEAAKELPPRFVGLRLEPEPEVVRMDGKEVWVVDHANVRLRGMVEAAAKAGLVLAEWSAGDKSKSILSRAGQSSAEFAVEFNLSPGKMTPLRLRAKSTQSDESAFEHAIVFHPRPAQVVIDAPSRADVLSEPFTLTGTYRTAHDGPVMLSVRVVAADGKEKIFKPELGAQAAKWRAALSLFPGANRIEVTASNEWRRAEPVSLALNYRRPPRIIAFPATVQPATSNRVSLPLTVESPSDRPLTGFAINGKPARIDPPRPKTDGGKSVWNVDLPAFVNDGERDLDRLSIAAVTDEGESLPVVIKVLPKLAPPRPPAARFLTPAADDTTGRTRYTVSFRVESAKKLERVEIMKGNTSLYQANLDKVERDTTRYVLQGEAELALEFGVNPLELIAVNADGRSPSARVVVSVVKPSVLVSVDRLELMNDKGNVERVLEPNGDGTFPTVPRSLVWLTGKVRWSDPLAKALDDPRLGIVVRVGDCRQFPVELKPRGQGADSAVRRFSVPAVLIGETNRIQVEVPGVGQQERSSRVIEFACAEPTRQQRLHLLIIGIGVEDGAELKRRVLDGLGVDARNQPRSEQGPFVKQPPFEQCILYRVLHKDVESAQVVAQLKIINKEIKRLNASTGWLNDVVLIYYQGEDLLAQNNERWLKMSRYERDSSAPVNESAVSCQQLPRVPGAPLLLLNVTGKADARQNGPDWGGDPGMGLIRYSLLGSPPANNVNPKVLSALREATQTKRNLGEVVQFVNSKVEPQFSGQVILSSDQAARRISEPVSR